MRLGDLLCDKWRIVRVLGAGGMATVYEANHRNGKRVAIKILHPELRSNEQACARFLREGYIANRVDHPSVPSVLDDGETAEGDAFLVMELLHGETLESRSKTGILPQEAQRIALAVLDVLSVAHDKGIVHRDVKPSNVFLTQDGLVKLLDFGIARMREATQEQHSTTLSRGGSALGTPSFMAPEQARGHWDEVDSRTDIWGVGALMFALLTGRNVHQGQTTNELMILSATSPAPPIASIRPGLSAGLSRIVDRALSFHRELRWPDARAMHAALQALQLQPNPEDSRAVTSLTAVERTAVSTTSDQLSAVVELPRRARRSGFFSLAAVVLSSLAVAWLTRQQAIHPATSARIVTPTGHVALATSLAVTATSADRGQDPQLAKVSAVPNPPGDAPGSAAPNSMSASTPGPVAASRENRTRRVPRVLPAARELRASAAPSVAASSGADAWLERQK